MERTRPGSDTDGFHLFVGNRNYSSWSLRGWLALRATGVPFGETMVPLHVEGSTEALRAVSPAARVPCLLHDGLLVWDTIAIAEYLVELFPEAGLWPQARVERARARSLVAEMHAGFTALRATMSMDMRARRPDHRPSDEASADIARIREIWREQRAHHGGAGPFLFGDWTLADCFYAPVVSRFLTYGVPLAGAEAAYADAVRAHPDYAAWYEMAEREEIAIPPEDLAGI